MRQKELRIALVCYGGVSLAVYMHGVTKEIWHLTRASRASHADEPSAGSSEAVYRALIDRIAETQGLHLRVLPDILSGASAGGINAVFLAQAIHSGQSLDPLTDLWLDNADVERLVDPDARPLWRFAKFWAQPFVEWLLRRPGNAVSESVSPEARKEVRHKLSRFIRGRWFQPPFSGLGFSGLLCGGFVAMREGKQGAPLLPAGHPIDLMVTATDFRGHRQLLRLNSPKLVEESEHRIAIGFCSTTPKTGGLDLANPLELTFAARATASFPGAFPPLRLTEIDDLAMALKMDWPTRESFVSRVMPVHARKGESENVSLIDGSVLVNKPFAGAIDALSARPAQREVDRRFVYIDPRPDRVDAVSEKIARPVGFFEAMLGSISIIPREQPIRDNLLALDEQSRDAERLRRIIDGLRPEVDRAVEKLFGRTFFLDRPNPRRLKSWRNKAQQEAAEQAGYAFQSYAQAKFSGIIERIAKLALRAAPELNLPDGQPIEAALRAELSNRGLDTLAAEGGGASAEAIAFFRAHDLGFRIRRLRLLLRRLTREWQVDPEIPGDALDLARGRMYEILALYQAYGGLDNLGDEFREQARDVLQEPGVLLDYLEQRRHLAEIDSNAEVMLSNALGAMPRNLRRRMLLTYLGFPFYDVSTLTLLPDEGMNEYDQVKVDRISPNDAQSIRSGGSHATLRGTELFNFGAFFSRAYRENDYLWGRLHGAERVIDLVCSTLEHDIEPTHCMRFKREAFLAILDEESDGGRIGHELIEQLRGEVLARPG